MKGLNVLPNWLNFPPVLKSCVKINALKEGGEELLCFVIKSGFRANPFVAATLIVMQASGEAIEASYRVFGYIEAGDIGRAQELLIRCQTRIKEPFLLNEIIEGYTRNGCFSEVLLIWASGYMRVQRVMDMYAKCGVVETAFDVFKSMDKKDLISWNTIIGGLAVHGYGADAFKLFSRTKSTGGNLDLITIIGILCASTHMGLGEDGLSYFKSMTDNIQLRLRLNTMVVLMIWSLGSSCGFHQKEAYRRRFLFGLHCLGRVGSKAIKRPMELLHAREIMYFEHAGWSIHCLVSETNDGSYSISLVSILPAVVEMITGCAEAYFAKVRLSSVVVGL
ncbi:hypothetical protein POTOM_036112 [Populus tomentosa]|uniref:Pentatricopeptide repeat-containing protein n=1 Tax=Populus tomentosa TaxID=118781 RepID=A0A8X7YVG6_POPTO|nr:hypothetical protein POTOM_036112 [Populus tomentosa]